MKRISILLLASVLAFISSSHADDAKRITNFKKVEASMVVDIYRQMSGLELVVDSRAKKVRTPVTILPSAPQTKAEALTQIEKELATQAGIVITRLDDKRASVTLKDSSPITR